MGNALIYIFVFMLLATVGVALIPFFMLLMVLYGMAALFFALF
jgi:hypothetical protein